MELKTDRVMKKEMNMVIIVQALDSPTCVCLQVCIVTNGFVLIIRVTRHTFKYYILSNGMICLVEGIVMVNKGSNLINHYLFGKIFSLNISISTIPVQNTKIIAISV